MFTTLLRVGFCCTTLVFLSACAGLGATPTPTPDFFSEPEPALVIVDGRVLPIRHAELRFEQSAAVAEVLVTAGTQVEAGAALAHLATAEHEVAVAQARAALDEAIAQYELLLAGAPEAVVAAAEAQIAQARAAAQQTAGRVTAAEIQAARDELQEAQALLARLTAGPRTTELTQAEAALTQAQTSLQSQRDALSATKHDAELRLSQAANVVRDAQDAYSRIYWENIELERRYTDDDLPQERKDAEAAALRAVASSEAALEQAHLALEHARLAEQNGIAAAEAQITQAAARRDQLLAGADSDQIAGARARVSAAQARLNQLTGSARSGELAAAQARVTQAQAGLAEVEAAPQPAAVAAADARVRVAQANLEQAELMLAKATLHAPFAGTIVKINLEQGVHPNAHEPAIVLADMSAWKIETSDLTEFDVVLVREGEVVQLSFDAIPDLYLEGVISAIEARGTAHQGDVIFTATVTPRSWDERLRWNMTATVSLGDL
ncbi:efflux RND transporter periplasmic adaptor subunit [Candidatus Viridilinea mediisalina]|uniref:RND transporter n=1 Tax=Candidatus Viridilinea mediisalina TaxID=2024553 RepID=A0A2A6RFP4_9CHLR|nr:HlyD family efflux transporter periplasmic adaptor subunit [Candidatus Viridilinea mediisalina]PDW01763.1 RND transporter [Candidatus Viridilinea mediisalina]